MEYKLIKYKLRGFINPLNFFNQYQKINIMELYLFIDEFNEWVNSDNVIQTAQNTFKCQCNQYKFSFTRIELYKYFVKEYM